MPENCIDKDLFGEPVRAKAKKASPRKIPLVVPDQRRRLGLGQAVTSYLKRFTGDTAHETAVKLAGTLLAGIILAWGAQAKYDWVGWSKAGIGNWITTVKPEE